MVVQSVHVIKSLKKVFMKSEIQLFQNQLSHYEQQIGMLLNSYNMSGEKFVVTLLNVVKKQPDLLNVDRASLFGAILTSAELGLPPNTPFGYSYIIPYKKSIKDGNGYKSVVEAQFQIGYQGHLEIMHRNPAIEDVTADIVYEKDEFKYSKGINPTLDHTPYRGDDRGERIGVYAIAYLRGVSRPKFVFLSKYDIEKFKKISQSADSKHSPWNGDDKDPMGWMWRKTAIKQLAKEVPKTEQLEKAINIDNAAEVGSTIILKDGQPQIAESGYVEQQKAELNAAVKQEKTQAVADNVAKSLFDEEEKPKSN
jgi:recombination protein RecT